MMPTTRGRSELTKVPVVFKAEPEDKARWQEEAYQQRITFGEWIRRRLNAKAVLDAPTLAEIAVRASSCEHRIPVGAWCKTCQVIKKKG